MRLEFKKDEEGIIVKRRGVHEESLIEHTDNFYVVDLVDMDKEEALMFVVTPRFLEAKISRVGESNRFLVELVEEDSLPKITAERINTIKSQIIDALESL